MYPMKYARTFPVYTNKVECYTSRKRSLFSEIFLPIQIGFIVSSYSQNTNLFNIFLHIFYWDLFVVFALSLIHRNSLRIETISRICSAYDSAGIAPAVGWKQRQVIEFFCGSTFSGIQILTAFSYPMQSFVNRNAQSQFACAKTRRTSSDCTIKFALWFFLIAAVTFEMSTSGYCNRLILLRWSNLVCSKKGCRTD